ncbi:hypothetical protein [Paractinoplanes toevensis]|uniref:Uncharacterized protein n=1 Tax=Paractinoplanes toevensis TaxID=571911 RepID=A0A920BQL5_9ACTN|nr:hypothetical protein [Actinoplanes toevensis]GIM97529.1 hypothetical protein Ato02nite_093220 [Actinoplanes toevensis]
MDDVNHWRITLLALRGDLRSLRDWAERQLDGDADWQNVTEYMTAALDALIAGENPPTYPS